MQTYVTETKPKAYFKLKKITQNNSTVEPLLSKISKEFQYGTAAGVSVSEDLRHSEALIHPLLRVL